MQNRVAFGDDVLGRLGEAPEGWKEETAAFEEKHAALRETAARSPGPEVTDGSTSGLIEEWDAALRRLVDRLRVEAPTKVAELLAPKAATSRGATPKAARSKAPKHAAKPPPKKVPPQKPAPAPAPQEPKAKRGVKEKKKAIRSRRGR